MVIFLEEALDWRSDELWIFRSARAASASAGRHVRTQSNQRRAATLPLLCPGHPLPVQPLCLCDTLPPVFSHSPANLSASASATHVSTRGGGSTLCMNNRCRPRIQTQPCACQRQPRGGDETRTPGLQAEGCGSSFSAAGDKNRAPLAACRDKELLLLLLPDCTTTLSYFSNSDSPRFLTMDTPNIKPGCMQENIQDSIIAS